MEITIKNKSRVEQLVTVFRYLQSLSDMVNIYLTEERLYIQGMDASHVCLSEVAISSKWFDTYNTVNMTLGVSCKILFKVINCWKDGQEIKLHCEDGGDKLYINFNGGNNINKSFYLKEEKYVFNHLLIRSINQSGLNSREPVLPQKANS